MHDLVDQMGVSTNTDLEPLPRVARTVDGSIPPTVAVGLLVAWMLGIAWLFAISPTPDPAQQISLLDELISTAMLASWLAVFVGLGARRRFGLISSIGAGALLAGAGVLCGVTGHTGLWIAIQIGVGSGLAGLGVFTARLT